MNPIQLVDQLAVDTESHVPTHHDTEEQGAAALSVVIARITGADVEEVSA